jgi:coproporphyrinogen III oxidase
MVHAVLNFHYEVDGTSAVGGFLGILPAATSEEDLATLKQTMDEMYEKYDIDSLYHRKMLCEGYDDDDALSVDNSYRRRMACVGGNFFGSADKPLMSGTENNFSFMLESFDRFVDAYMNIIELRKDDPYTAEDLAAQDAMRRNWLEDQLFADRYTTNVTAYEGWSFSNLPPEVKF